LHQEASERESVQLVIQEIEDPFHLASRPHGLAMPNAAPSASFLEAASSVILSHMESNWDLPAKLPPSAYSGPV
jgi:hypothetical protein